MNVMLGLLVPALVGVDYGWQPKSDGTIAYIVQVDAETFAEMQRNGQTIGSALPADVRGLISDFSFRVGRDPLPNQNTLPTAVTAAKPIAPIPDPISSDAAKPIETPIRINANYPPSNDIPGASTAPYGSTVTTPQPTTYNWGGTPPSVSIPQTALPPSNQSWAQNTVPASSATTQPMSTSGFPINPTATPPGANGVYPNSPTSASGAYPSSNGAYPSNTAPPSLNNGPRVAQPQPWQTPPREVTISARTPMEPNPPLTAANPSAAGPNLNPPMMPNTGGYPTGTQPGFNNNGYPPNNQGYPQQNPQMLPNNNPQYATNNYPPGTNPNAAPPQNPNDPYYAQRQQQQLQQQQQHREPLSASNVNPVGTQPTVNAPVKDDDWKVTMTLVLIGFLTSLAANFYFGWNTYQLRERCRMLLTDRGAF